MGLGCDQGHQDDEHNTPVPVTAVLAGGKTTIIANGSVVVQFNRLLNPGTVNRQTVTLLTAGGSPFAEPVVVYDPVLLTVTLSSPMTGVALFTAGQTYQVRIPVATSTQEGVLAIDNATVAAETELDFTALPFDAGAKVPPPEPLHFCVDVLPIFLANCAGSTCHSSPEPGSGSPPTPTGAFAGLVLDNSEGVLSTAVGHVAYESNVGAFARPSPANCPTTDMASCLFGLDMPIIDPGTAGSGNPANSWLLYKMLLAVPSVNADAGVVQCNDSQTAPYGTSPTVVITSAERATLSDYILGQQMPFPSDASAPLSMGELERVRLWIQEGAVVEDCSHCKCDADAGYVLEGGSCQKPGAGLDGSAGVDVGVDAEIDAVAPPRDASSPSDARKDAPSDAGAKG